MGILFSFLKAKRKIGHNKDGFGLFLTEKVSSEVFKECHVVDAMQKIALQAGGATDDRGIEVFWSPKITAKWDIFFAQAEGKNLVGINPGGDRENRRWAPDRFAAVAEKMIEQFHCKVILLGGQADRHIAASIACGSHSDIVNLSGKIPLEELPYVINRLDLLLTNDSGPMHIAAATQTPVVAIFGPEDPKLFGPYTTPALYRVIQKDTPCRPCRDDRCGRPSCLDLITPEEVLVACIELLNNKIMRDIPHH